MHRRFLRFSYISRPIFTISKSLTLYFFRFRQRQVNVVSISRINSLPSQILKSKSSIRLLVNRHESSRNLVTFVRYTPPDLKSRIYDTELRNSQHMPEPFESFKRRRNVGNCTIVCCFVTLIICNIPKEGHVRGRSIEVRINPGSVTSRPTSG